MNSGVEDKNTFKTPRKYSQEYVLCLFCGKSINLDSCHKHFKSNLCKSFQDKHENFDVEFMKFKKYINQIREKIKIETA